MYKLLFVDDDELIADSMRTILDWKTLNISEPLIAYSFDQACGVFERYKIDIMISDIEMLGDTGFELIDWVNARHPETVSSFLSCHARFDYAQQAIRLGVLGYLLKPVCEPELKELLLSSIKRLEVATKEADDSEGCKKWSETIRSVIAYIDANLHSPITRELISREMYISEGYLSRIFNKEVGVPLGEYITERRIKLAKKLLSQTDESITNISVCTGYNYPAYFSKTFREHTGLTPHQYRIKHHK